MEPVVNGLEGEFRDQVEFRRIDANSPDGQVFFQSFGLRGHPSYVILNSRGRLLWQGVGEQTYESLQANIQEVVENQ